MAGEKAALERRLAEEKTRHEEETNRLRKDLEGKAETAAMVVVISDSIAESFLVY